MRMVLEAWHEQEMSGERMYMRRATPFVEKDVRRDYLKFLVRQMLKETPSGTMSVSELYSAWAALSDPSRMASLGGMPVIVKDGSFRGEREWRLVMLPCDEDVVRDCEFIAGKPRLHTRLFGSDYELAQHIVDIVCSPHGHMRPRVEMIAALRKLSRKPRVSESTYKANG